MSQPLTDRNGVVCWECFKTIDLTAIETVAGGYRKVGFLKRLVNAPDLFSITCPYCGTSKSYFYSDVRPIAPNWSDEKARLESENNTLRIEVAQVKAEAKLLARELHNRTPEEIDQPSTIPKETAQKPPTPPEEPSPQKKRGDRPPYVQ